MKRSFFILLLSVLSCVANSQRGRTSAAGTSGFSIGFEAGLPVGENGKIYSGILGGSLQYEGRPASDVGITVSAGYLNYSIKNDYGSGNVGFVPLLGGVKYYFSPAAFLHAQIGAAVGTRKDQGTSFAYSPGIGLKLTQNLEATIKYAGISNKGGRLENVGARIALNF